MPLFYLRNLAQFLLTFLTKITAMLILHPENWTSKCATMRFTQPKFKICHYFRLHYMVVDSDTCCTNKLCQVISQHLWISRMKLKVRPWVHCTASELQQPENRRCGHIYYICNKHRDTTLSAWNFHRCIHEIFVLHTECTLQKHSSPIMYMSKKPGAKVYSTCHY